MTKKEWDPFTEAQQHLDRYSCFFDQKELDNSNSDHPQLLEDFMDENCPQNYCYAWLWTHMHNGGIDSLLIGVPEHIAFAIKLSTGVDPIDTSEYEIGKRCYNNHFVMYMEE